ncbi:MAG: hypothetical protein ACJAS4_003882 [Bacteriovoracaceae bacterium]|jgi:hypothetical protein
MIDHLHKIYEYSTERIRYAEGKNGALLAISGLVLFRLLSLEELLTTKTIGFYFSGLALFTLGIIVSLLAIVARWNIPRLMRNQHKLSPPPHLAKFDNILSSIRVCYFTPEEFARLLATKLGLTNHQISPIEIDFAEHIIANSKVIIFKYKCFRFGMVCMIIGVLCTITVKLINFN